MKVTQSNSNQLTWIIFGGLLLFSSHILGNEELPFQITGMSVPAFVERGADVNLTCNFTSLVKINKISWLLNATTGNPMEFYVYSFEDQDAFIYDSVVNGRFKIDRIASTNTTVVLKDVNLKASDVYRCRLTGPLEDQGKTVYKDKPMKVGVIPKSPPLISGQPEDESISLGYKISMNCTSAPSVPAAELTWHINGKEAPKAYLKDFPPRKNLDELLVKTVGLNFELEKKHFKDGLITFNCTAQINQTKDVIYSRYDDHQHKSSDSDGQNNKGPTSAASHYRPTFLGVKIGSPGIGAFILVVATGFTLR